MRSSLAIKSICDSLAKTPWGSPVPACGRTALYSCRQFFFDQHVCHSIRPRRFMGAKEIADRFERAIGAAVENEIHVMGEDTAVCRYAGLYLHDRSMSWIPALNSSP